MVDSVGYNLHKFLRHVQQYCSEHHTYAVKCKNTYGMKNNVQPPLSSHCFTLLKILLIRPDPSPVKPESLGMDTGICIFLSSLGDSSMKARWKATALN